MFVSRTSNVPAKLSKACPYAGCQYISSAWYSAINDHNLSSHVSNLHAQKTKVWYGAVQVTIYRDLTTKAFGCPCGGFTHNNASLVRLHARKRHKGSADAHLRIDKSMADPTSTEEDVFLLPPPCQSTSRGARKGPDTEHCSSTKLKVGTGFDSSLRKHKQTTLSTPRINVASSFQLTVSLRSKRLRGNMDEDTSDDVCPVKARRLDATMINITPIASSHHAKSVAPITASTSAAVPSNMMKAQAASSRQPVHTGKPVQAPRRPIVPSPPSRCTAPEDLLSDDLVEDSTDSEDEVTKVALRLTNEMRVRCELGDLRAHSIWTCLKCRWVKKTARTTAKVAVSTSTTPAANPFSTAKAPQAASSKAKAVESSSNASKRQSLASFTIVSQAPRHVAFTSFPDSESSSGPEPSYLHVSDDQPKDSTPAEMTPRTIKRGAVIEPPVRRQCMTKQKRECDFRHWFNAFHEDYNAKKVAGSALPNDGPEPVKSLQKA
ncbi:hypothetical protein PYCCODRAFT_1422237 [Trametes coccinea BRFM310]|uniref:Uncharacterized protein n=1 Tax=Trametes coccinea (strain BRFM310) TaxID=1353009 RepID=A0A1Y2J2L5_TRAC3|nr:hypothetical protein PYCCODRAFT_1422237 [Trametes coccinea BRFM310]